MFDFDAQSHLMQSLGTLAAVGLAGATLMATRTATEVMKAVNGAARTPEADAKAEPSTRERQALPAVPARSRAPERPRSWYRSRAQRAWDAFFDPFGVFTGPRAGAPSAWTPAAPFWTGRTLSPPPLSGAWPAFSWPAFWGTADTRAADGTGPGHALDGGALARLMSAQSETPHAFASWHPPVSLPFTGGKALPGLLTVAVTIPPALHALLGAWPGWTLLA